MMCVGGSSTEGISSICTSLLWIVFCTGGTRTDCFVLGDVWNGCTVKNIFVSKTISITSGSEKLLLKCYQAFVNEGYEGRTLRMFLGHCSMIDDKLLSTHETQMAGLKRRYLVLY